MFGLAWAFQWVVAGTSFRVCPCLCVRVQLSKQFFSNKGCGAGHKEEVKTAPI